MTTHKIEVAHEPLVKQKFNWLLAIGIFIVGLGLGIFVTNLTTIATEIGLRPVAEAENMASRQRAIEAEAARYTSLGLFYAAGNEAARYSAMAKFYLTEDEANVQRAIQAETARYNGLADFYGAEDGANSLAWPPRPTQFRIAENAGVRLDENALAQSEAILPSIENEMGEQIPIWFLLK